MMRYFIAFILFTCIAFGQNPEQFPALTGRVVDSANILTQQTKQNLENILANEEHNSSNQIVIATVKSLNGYAIADFALNLARHWGIGQKAKDNGVLLLVAPNERKVRIEVGYGLEGALTDKISHEIIEYTMLPHFKQQDYDTGVSKGANQIISATKGEYVADEKIANDELLSKLPFLATMFGFLVLTLSDKFKSKTMRSLGMSSFLSAFSLPVTMSMFGVGSLIPFGIFAIIFIIIFLLTRNMKPQKLSSNNDDLGYIGGGFGNSGFGGSFGGGFSGGGGSFGGGGASGGW